MGDAVFIGNVNRRNSICLECEQGIDLPGIFVEQEKLFVVDSGGTQQVETVGFGLCQCLLVPVNDLGGIVLHAPQSDESAALEILPEGAVKV